MLWITPDQKDLTCDLTVITVTWNSAKTLPGLAESLKLSLGAGTAEWIIVDNASKDHSLTVAKEAFPEAICLQNTENAGFAKANNQAWEQARGRHILLLNPDMTVEPEALQKTIDTLDMYPDIAILGGKLVAPDQTIIPQLRRYPTIWNLLCIQLKLAKLFPFLQASYLGKDLDLTKAQDVDSVRGSYFAINESVKQKLGMLDERYFLWFEEVDYCRNAKNQGLRIAYEPAIVAHDQLSHSFAQRESTWKNNVFARSMIAYVDKWHSPVETQMIRVASVISYAMTWCVERCSKLWHK